MGKVKKLLVLLTSYKNGYKVKQINPQISKTTNCQCVTDKVKPHSLFLYFRKKIILKKKLYIETYGCQMNFADSEIVVSIIKQHGAELTDNIKESDIILINTCSIRDNAEQRVRNRLQEIKSLKKKKPKLKIGIIGCMAERLKTQLFDEEESLDLLAGPDSYRFLPELLELTETGQKAANVMLSEEETYDNIEPVRYDSNGVSAYISIMRGCENFCAYCVVPFTRGKERSRNPHTIIKEATELFNNGYREVTLLGQNVNSYKWDEGVETFNFAKLITQVAAINPLLRVRFSTSHPKDISDELIYTISYHYNICKSIHLALQSGSNRILQLMNRKYTREWYLDRITSIRNMIPDCSISTDTISGFCSETDDDHADTLSLMKEARFDYAFMFKYSKRDGTVAAQTMVDDISEDIKLKRLNEIIAFQRSLSAKSHKADIGQTYEVLVDGFSKRSKDNMTGRTTHNKVVVFPKQDVKLGTYLQIKITSCTTGTLIGEVV